MVKVPGEKSQANVIQFLKNNCILQHKEKQILEWVISGMVRVHWKSGFSKEKIAQIYSFFEKIMSVDVCV